MNTYRVTASYITYCYAEVEAESEDEAFDLARDMDGGEFDSDSNEDGDWNIESVQIIEPVAA
jgi:hypothetical protein